MSVTYEVGGGGGGLLSSHGQQNALATPKDAKDVSGLTKLEKLFVCSARRSNCQLALGMGCEGRVGADALTVVVCWCVEADRGASQSELLLCATKCMAEGQDRGHSRATTRVR